MQLHSDSDTYWSPVGGGYRHMDKMAALSVIHTHEMSTLPWAQIVLWTMTDVTMQLTQQQQHDRCYNAADIATVA